MKRFSNRTQILNKFKAGMRNAVEEFDRANKSAISDPNYWKGFEDRITYRSNGEVVVGAFRNIKDTGDLLSTQNWSLADDTATFSWGGGQTPAVGVFFGQRTEFGYIPGRNWIDLALSESDLGLAFKEGFHDS